MINLSEDHFDKLLRRGKKLSTYLREITKEVLVNNTKAILHSYIIEFDGNKRPRDKDFARLLSFKLVDYCIPRSEIEKAKRIDEENNTTEEYAALQSKARGLLTNLKKTGEGGELLLYSISQEFLKIPQLLCKMPLKTSSKMHFHGVDGVHANFDDENQMLALYWGESKLHSSIDNAVSDCMDSIEKFLNSSGGSDSTDDRDLQLITDNLDLLDDQMETALLTYLNKDDPNYNKVLTCGICVIGFDYTKYPSTPNTTCIEEVIKHTEKSLEKWLPKVEKAILKKTPLDTFKLHVFLIPFPNVQKFREAFLKELGIAINVDITEESL